MQAIRGNMNNVDYDKIAKELQELINPITFYYENDEDHIRISLEVQENIEEQLEQFFKQNNLSFDYAIVKRDNKRYIIVAWEE